MNTITIQEALDTPSGTIIPGIRGTIVEIRSPFKPTEKQAQYGIHKQDITVSDGTNSINVELSYEKFHVDVGREGQEIVILSGVKDGGVLDGVKVDEWNGVTKVVVGKMGYVSLKDGGTAPAPRPAQDAARPARGEPSDKGWFAEQARAHAEIYKLVASAYQGTGVPVENLTSITTSLFIEGNRKGKQIGGAAPAPQPAPAPAPAPQKAVERPAAAAAKIYPDDLPDPEFADICWEHLLGEDKDNAYQWLQSFLNRDMLWEDIASPMREHYVALLGEPAWKKRVAGVAKAKGVDIKDREAVWEAVIRDGMEEK